jgi:hypothetical protein
MSSWLLISPYLSLKSRACKLRDRTSASGCPARGRDHKMAGPRPASSAMRNNNRGPCERLIAHRRRVQS